MNIYKEVSRLKLRFKVANGVLSVEQLWGLNMSQLSTAIVEYKEVLNTHSKEDDDLAFLGDTMPDSKDVQSLKLAFEVLKDVYITKKTERDSLKEQADVKAHNQRILELIASKQDQELQGKSVQELEAMLK